jgi:hypothetical protein
MRRRLLACDQGYKNGQCTSEATTKELSQELVQRLNQSRSWELGNTVFADNGLNVLIVNAAMGDLDCFQGKSCIHV